MILSTPTGRPGDGGGPVVDADCRVVGVHSSGGKIGENIQVREVQGLLSRLGDKQP
jgi:hypothetical protein